EVTAPPTPPRATGPFPRGSAQRSPFHAATRTAVKLDFICGLLLRATEMQQRSGAREVQAVVGELLGMRHNIWALSTAMAADAQPGPGGYLLPNLNYALQWR